MGEYEYRQCELDRQRDEDEISDATYQYEMDRLEAEYEAHSRNDDDYGRY